ncbi:MAG: dynamin family protein [Synergistaceae bacterium]|nr:dynamin family protein [Synergistaceae bacterium]
MVSKSSYIEKIHAVSEILKRYSDEGLRENSAVIEKNINDWAFRVVLIGGFSAGKSAFLNKLIGQKLLAESQGPETSLATEISWAPTDFCEAVSSDGTVRKISVSEAVENPPKDAEFIAIHLNTKFFRDRPEIVIVDFPGLDSNLEAHDKAIASYIGRGSAFLLFVPASNGVLQESERRFIVEAARYPQGLACFVSKSDLVHGGQAADVAKYIAKQIADIYGTDIPVEVISSKEDTKEEFMAKAAKAIDAFSPQNLFDVTFMLPINILIRKGLAMIASMIESSKLDTNAINDKIAECERKRKELQKQLDRETKELDRKYEREIIPGIVNRVNSALNASISSLTDAAMSGQARFSSAVQSIIRPILNDVPEKISASLRTITSNILVSIPASKDSGDDDRLRQIILDAAEIITAPIIARTPDETTSTPGATKQNKRGSGVGTSVAAVSAAMINPYLGFAVALAPVVAELIVAFRGNKAAMSAQANQREQVRQHLEESVIPQIVSKLESDITPAMLETRDDMMEKIQTSISEAIAIEEKALQDAKNQADEQRKDHDSRIAELTKDYEALEALLIAEVQE